MATASAAATRSAAVDQDLLTQALIIINVSFA
jgi:hypothetical protein